MQTFSAPALRLDTTNWHIEYDATTRRYLIRSTHIHAAQISWFDPEYWAQQKAITGTTTGRGITYFIQYNGIAMVLREYLRGGVIAKFVKRHFWFNGLEHTRVYQEMALLDAMQQHGLNVPKPIGGLIQRCGVVYRNQILLERISGAQDFHAHCQHDFVDNVHWQALGAEIAKMHQMGVYHHDLNIENVLLDNAGKVWLIDFDKCKFMQPDPQWQIANLARLARSIRKQRQQHADYCINEANWQAVLTSYSEQQKSIKLQHHTLYI